MGDVISRQALCEYALNQKDKAVTPNDIMRFPSIKPKTGRWIGDKCSRCGNERAWYGGQPDYCPDCGKKLKA